MVTQFFFIEYLTQNVIFHVKSHVTKHEFWGLLILKSQHLMLPNLTWNETWNHTSLKKSGESVFRYLENYLPAVNVARHRIKVPKITKDFIVRMVGLLYNTELIYWCMEPLLYSTLYLYNNKPSKNKLFLILLSSHARYSQEPKLKRIFEILWVLFEKISVFSSLLT